MLATSKIYQTLIGNDTLISMMASMRENEVEDENMIFNDQIPRNFKQHNMLQSLESIIFKQQCVAQIINILQKNQVF